MKEVLTAMFLILLGLLALFYNAKLVSKHNFANIKFRMYLAAILMFVLAIGLILKATLIFFK